MDQDFEEVAGQRVESPMGRARDDEGVFVIVAEWASQGPIVLESEGPCTSRRAAMERAGRMAKTHGFIRWCVAKLTFETGNPLALADLRRMQE